MSKLTDKLSIVTGASKGIGTVLAKGLAAVGPAGTVNHSSVKGRSGRDDGGLALCRAAETDATLAKKIKRRSNLAC